MFDIIADKRKKLCAGTMWSKHLHDFTLLQHAGNQVQHAPSADVHRHEMAQLDALEAHFRVDVKDVNYNFSDDRT
jgi:hypothetical protein